MEPTNVKFYHLGNGGDLIFERDLDGLSEFLGRPHPEFHGVEINDQHGGELQWVITADLRGKMEPPTYERILFSFRESSWMDGLARALQEALARRGQNVTQKELDNSRGYANQIHFALTQHGEAIRMLNKDRKSLRLQRAKKDATIGGGAFLSDDDDFEEDELTEEEDYEFLEAAEDGIIPIDVDVDTMENNLEVAGVEANEKVMFATHYLAGPARAWWTSTRAMNGGQVMTWEDFKLKFSKYHGPPGLIKKMRDEFRELKQGRMTVVEYATVPYSSGAPR
ncbi:hypothetical protein QYE76_065072 [Lolium multiflorum]|uniref:Retrotransposon gag domain-containing protein n=1 Tax=Lolium multiflorum TaxID=4521 RepID=A0AAD8WAV2_LOLMU|nr:hypothetical protein QYE76_065072 [Lolium multiflorum]